jgi:hypothetical protein
VRITSKLPAYLRPALVVPGEPGQVLANAKDTGAVLAQLGPMARRALTAAASSGRVPWGPAADNLLARAELLGALAGIEETVLHYQGERGRPRAKRVTTEMEGTQRRLYDLFGLGSYAPKP